MLKYIVYILYITVTMAWFAPATVWAADAQDAQASGTEPVIQPALERRNIKLPQIDTEDFEVGAFSGIYSAEDFGSHFLLGLQISYHITEDFFIDLVVGHTKVSDQTFADNFIFLFTDRVENLLYYQLALGYNIFPGEIFVGRNRAYASGIYVTGALGNTSFNDEDFLTTTVGVGARILITDLLAVHIGTRDHIFETDITGRKKLTHNISLQAGLTIFF